MPTNRRADDARWRSAADVLAVLRREPGITRAAAARRLGLSSGSATEITARMREARLLAEEAAPAGGRGRPSTLLVPDPDGPVVLAVDVRHEDWRCAVVAVDGRVGDLASHRHEGRDPAAVLAAVRRTVQRQRDRYGRRLRAVSVAVAGTVRDGRLVQASTLGWGPVELAAVAAGTDLPVLVGNDATLAGVAETRTGAARAAHTVLHLSVDVGIGGALIVDGRPVAGAAGSGGEYGHLPFGDRALRCPCGAAGCWDLMVDGRALARRLGADPGPDPRAYAHDVLGRTDRRARAGVRAVAADLAAGIAGLVNAHDPDLVTLGGLGGPLRSAAPGAFGTAYTDGLMAFHRAAPPPVVDAVHGTAGALYGASAVALDLVTSGGALAEWAAGGG